MLGGDCCSIKLIIHVYINFQQNFVINFILNFLQSSPSCKPENTEYVNKHLLCLPTPYRESNFLYG